MSSNENHKHARPDIEPDLLDRGIHQLAAEIEILQEWLDSLGPDEHEPRRAYQDMLRSRHDMLLTLKEQRERLNPAP